MGFSVEVPVLEVEIAEEVTIQLPSLRLAVLLDVHPAGTGPYVTRVRSMVTDAALAQFVEELRCELVKIDLRKLDPHLSDFTEPVRADFQLRLEWSQADQVHIHIQEMMCKFCLPE